MRYVYGEIHWGSWDTVRYGEILWDSVRYMVRFGRISWDSTRFGEIQWNLVRFSEIWCDLVVNMAADQQFGQYKNFKKTPE